MEATKFTAAINISVTKTDRNLLRRIIAERMMKEPEHAHTVSGLCREIIGEHLQKYFDGKESIKGS